MPAQIDAELRILKKKTNNSAHSDRTPGFALLVIRLCSDGSSVKQAVLQVDAAAAVRAAPGNRPGAALNFRPETAYYSPPNAFL